jgi:hypothetical protein
MENKIDVPNHQPESVVRKVSSDLPLALTNGLFPRSCPLYTLG